MNAGALATIAVTLFVVSSSVGVGVAVGGASATADVNGVAAQFAQGGGVSSLAPRGRWNPATSRGEIILDRSSYYRVYQGERDVSRWRRARDDADVTGTALTGRGGAAEDDVLDLSGSIPRDQTVGRYSDDDVSALVVEPRISSLRLRNPRGVELGSDVTVSRSQRLLLRADWNFVEAEDLQVDLRRNGDRYEREALSTAATSEQLATLPSGFPAADLAREVQGVGTTGRSTAAWLFDFSDLDAGVYTLRVEGVDDLTTGDAARTITVRVGTESRPTLGFDERTVSRGEWARYTLSGVEPGDYHAISVLRSATSDPNRLFRAVGDTVVTGSTNRSAYAVLRVPESGRAVGALDTGLLDTGRTTVTLHGARSTLDDAVATVDDTRGVDDVSVDVRRSGLTTNLDSLTYTIGSEIDVRGTGESADRVALYVRGNDRDWYLLTLNGRATTPVGSDGVWVARRVVLSDGGDGGQLLRIPGTYRLAVVDAGGFDGDPPRRISRGDFDRLQSEQRNIRTVAPGLVGRPTTYGGGVADVDDVTVGGVAAGATEVAVVFVDERGGIRTRQVRVRSDTSFEEDLSLGGLERGRVTALVATAGRDGAFGSGSVRAPDGRTLRLDGVSGFLTYVDALRDRGLTGAQILARIDGQVLSVAGSDDLAVRQEFRLAAPRTVVRDVVPASTPDASGLVAVPPGGTMFVRGTTNRNPDAAIITVEVIEGPSAAAFPSVTTAAWGADGVWSAQLAVPAGATPGTYTITVDDGENTVTREVVIGRQRTPTERPTTPTERPATERLRTATERPATSTAAATSASTPTSGGGTGFGPSTALVALLLLAVGVALSRRY